MDSGASSDRSSGSDDPGTRADSGADSRRRLVDAAVELAVEHHRLGTGLRDAFAYLTPSSVAERAGLSRGLIYHHWGDRDHDGSEAFARFLVTVSEEVFALGAIPEELVEMADLLPDNVSDVLLTLTSAEMDRYTGEQGAMVRASQALAIHGVWPEEDASTVVQRLGAMYERLGAKLGLEPVPPLTFEDIGFSVMCVFEGFAMFRDIFPERVHAPVDWTPTVPPTDVEAQWNVASIALEGVIRHLTRPVGAAPAADQAGPDSERTPREPQ